MTALHLTSFFRAQGDRETVEQQCDALMDALLAAEQGDPSVTDSTVSVDLNLGVVQVEGYAEGADRDEVEARILSRVHQVVSDVVGLQGAQEMPHQTELVRA